MIQILEKVRSNLDLNFELLLDHGFKFIFIFVIGFLLIVALQFSCNFYQDYRIRKKMVVLKILPKKSIELKETEKLIKNLHSMLLNTKLRKYIYGRQYMSFEIGAKEGKINFYVSVPEDMKDRIVDRIYASYTDIAIEVTEDYIPNIEKGIKVYTSEIELAYHHTLKIKSQDILQSIISALVDLNKKDFVGVQVLLRPIDNRWQIRGRQELAKFEKEGIRPGEKKSFGEKASETLESALISIEQEIIGGKSKTIIGSGPSSRKTRIDRKEITVASDKISEVGFDTTIRLVATGKFRKGNTARIKALVAAFTEINAENKFKRTFIGSHRYIFDRYKSRKMHLEEKKNIFVPSELASFALRLPGEEILEKYRVIEKLIIKEFPAPAEAISTNSGSGYVFACNTYRAEKKLVEIKPKDLVRHMVIQGKTGSGKSEWAKTLFLEQISNKYDENGKLIRKGLGAMLLEPHGKLADEILALIPEDRRKDTIVFDIFSDNPWGFNFCKVPERESDELTPEQLAQKTLDEAIEIFKKSFADVWSEKNEYYIENAIRAITDVGYTMLELPRMFSDSNFRDSVIPKIKDKKVKKFWVDKFKKNAKGQIDSSVESTAQSVEYKLDKFLRSKELRRVLGQNECIDFKEILDENKIIIFKFSKDKLSKDKISFLGGIAIKLITVAAFSRKKEMWGNPFLLLVDETQNFVCESIKDILYELRKYGVGLALMHQERSQMQDVPGVLGLLDAIYNNVGTSITFTTGDGDAPFFAKKYGPRVDQSDLQNLPSRYGYCKLLVNGKTSDTFNIYSLDRPEVTAEEGVKSVAEIIAYNAEGKMSAEELDKMIESRYEDDSDTLDFSYEPFEVDVDNEEIIEKEFENKEKVDIEADYNVEIQENEEIEEKVSNYWD